MGGGCCFSAIAAVVVLFQIVRRVIPWFYQNLIGPTFVGPAIDIKKMGSWALVTGATEGIGKAYAKAFAKKGLNLILISRSIEKLEAVSKEIAEQHPVEIKIVDVDFTHGPEIYEKIEKNIMGLDVGVLVNNIGISYNKPEFFLDIPNLDTFLRDIISCNIHSVTFMTKIVLPGMVQRKKGVIINMSSMAATIPNPLLSIYSATKAFVDKFSEDLQTEYKKDGIIVQSVLPGFVCSNMSKIKKPTLLTPSADTYAEAALRTVGISGHTSGYFPHALMKLSLDAIATFATTAVANNFVLKQLQNIANRASRKKKSN